MRNRSFAQTLLPVLFTVLCLSLLLVPSARAQSLKARYADQLKAIKLVTSMESALYAASESEKLAVMADTDEDSETYAQMTRSIETTLEQHRQELQDLFAKGGQEKEAALLAEFGKCWNDYRKLDERILVLAVKNTNLKAARLSHGKAMQELEQFKAALSRVAPQGGQDAAKLQGLKDSAMLAAQEVQILQSPHIDEPDLKAMDALETRMNVSESEADKAMQELKGLAPGGDDAMREALAAWDAYRKTTTEIVALSRENSNVDSFMLSLGRKRAATAACAESLAALKKVVFDRDFKATR